MADALFGLWGLLDLRTLTMRPSDVTGSPLGASSRVAGVTVTAEYDRVVETDNGTRIEPGVRTPLTRDPANGYWYIGLLPSDDPRIVTGEGVCVTIRVETESRHGRGGSGHGSRGRVLGSKTIQMHVTDAPVTNISDKDPVTPVPVAALSVSPQQVNDAAKNAATALAAITPITSISATPNRVGQVAVVAGVIYMAAGTSAASDWKRIS